MARNSFLLIHLAVSMYAYRSHTSLKVDSGLIKLVPLILSTSLALKDRVWQWEYKNNSEIFVLWNKHTPINEVTVNYANIYNQFKAQLKTTKCPCLPMF